MAINLSFAPPFLSLPSLNMTALSYSCTTCTLVIKMMGMLVVKLTLIQRHREKGRVAMINKMERQVKIQAADPGPCGSAANRFVI